jgi:hypothetical protein
LKPLRLVWPDEEIAECMQSWGHSMLCPELVLGSGGAVLRMQHCGS